MTVVEKLVEQTAFKFRQHIRAKAGLAVNWEKASDNMKDWYRQKAYDYLVSTGELVVER